MAIGDYNIVIEARTIIPYFLDPRWNWTLLREEKEYDSEIAHGFSLTRFGAKRSARSEIRRRRALARRQQKAKTRNTQRIEYKSKKRLFK